MIFTLNLRTLRPLRLCGRYSEFRLRLCRTGSFVVISMFLFVDPRVAQAGAPRLKIPAGVGGEVFYMATEREKSRRETDNQYRQVIRQLCHHLLEDRLALLQIHFALSFL